jgi:hypothetical protein
MFGIKDIGNRVCVLHILYLIITKITKLPLISRKLSALDVLFYYYTVKTHRIYYSGMILLSKI